VSVDSRHSLLHQRVLFKICDIYIPEAREVLWRMYNDHELLGRVISQINNTDGEPFVAVEVEGFQDRLIVPVNKVKVSSQ
jgi:hypothetical protein